MDNLRVAGKFSTAQEVPGYFTLDPHPAFARRFADVRLARTREQVTHVNLLPVSRAFVEVLPLVRLAAMSLARVRGAEIR
jgi:hypothetical protein